MVLGSDTFRFMFVPIPLASGYHNPKILKVGSSDISCEKTKNCLSGVDLFITIYLIIIGINENTHKLIRITQLFLKLLHFNESKISMLYIFHNGNI